jgi:S1-C subfamily serine protease
LAANKTNRALKNKIGGVLMETNQKMKKRLPAVLIVTIIIVSLIGGSVIGYSVSSISVSSNISDLTSQVSTLQTQLSSLQTTQSTTNQDSNIQTTATQTAISQSNSQSLSELYEEVKNSVVIVEGLTASTMFGQTSYSEIQGSGFVYNYSGQMVIITNNHVVDNVVNITVTFINGNAYPAELLGADQYADLAVLSTDAPENEYYPLEITTSSTLEVGDPLAAVGGPYGLAGTMTTGIVSALNRTITEEMSGSYPISDVIQTSTPINSGNSGGPLLNYEGQVVGITTAIVSNSDNLGFAIPSDTILREIGSLITTGTYTNHSTIGAYGTDMTYRLAQAMNTDVTYGWLITKVTNGGPADTAGIQGGTKQTAISSTSYVIGGDIIIALNGTRIRNIDDLSTYLERCTVPGETVIVTIIRDNQQMDLSLVLGSRPAQT